MLSDIDSWSESSFCSESSGKSELEPAETISNKQVKEKGNNNVSKLNEDGGCNSVPNGPNDFLEANHIWRPELVWPQ